MSTVGWHPVDSDQLGQLTELQPEFKRLGSSVVGIAVDSPWSHAALAAEMSITFPLLSEDAPADHVARAFGVYASACTPRRPAEASGLCSSWIPRGRWCGAERFRTP